MTILVLLATPLHDPGAPMPRQDAAGVVAEQQPAPQPRIAVAETATAAPPRAVVRRYRLDGHDVPAVIYETRRARYRARLDTRHTVVTASAPAGMGRTGASLAPQSP